MQVFTSVLVLTIVFLVFVITDIRSYKQRKVESMESLAQVVGTNCISTLEFNDDDAAKQILEELHTVSPEIIQAEITDKDGKLFATYIKPGAANFPVPADANENKFTFTGNRLFVSSPIISNNSTIGKVLLQVELSELQQIKQFKYELAALLFLFALLFSFLIAFFIQGYISKRLLRLVNTIKRVSKTGTYEPIADDGKDEISTLIAAFNKLMQQVQESQKRKDEFIGIASHELKTPLTSIKGYMDLLKLKEDRQPNKQFLEKALQNIKKLESLISDLLDVSKIQTGQLELTICEFDMDVLLDETIAAVQMVSTTHQIIRENKAKNEIVIADRQRIEQVLVNLLSNAIKYSPGEKEVFVESKKSGDELIIKVSDSGIGVPKEEQTDIFERFYRTKGISTHISGFGLGLYICKDIIKRHQGKIWVESQAKGSAFYFSLPLKKSE
jgi:signal transduction histidine kinase